VYSGGIRESKGELDMKLFSNSIPMGRNPKTFQDLIKEAQASNKVVKTAAKKEEDEAPSSGQPEAEAKLVNEPEVEDEKDCKNCLADEQAEIKEAEKKGDNESDCADSSGQLDVEPLEQKGDGRKPVGGGEKKEEKEANADNFGDKKAPPFGKKEEDAKEDAKEDDEEAKDDDGEEKEAKTTEVLRFQRIAKMTSETKNMLKEYWGQLFDSDYVDAMIDEK